jgi:hypothetical protein
MITVEQASEWMDVHLTRSAFRLELLDQYEVASDGGEVARYLAGEPGPDLAQKNPWLDHLRRERAAGIRRYRVHVLTTPLTPYLRYECEWGYAPNSNAGEEIYIVDQAEQAAPLVLPVNTDFWLLDDEHVLLMHYDEAGRLLGCEPLPDDQTSVYVKVRDLALAAASPFRTWWARHPQEHREHFAA